MAPTENHPTRLLRTLTVLSIAFSVNANWLLFELLGNSDALLGNREFRPVSICCLILLLPGLVILIAAYRIRTTAGHQTVAPRSSAALDRGLYIIAVTMWLIPSIPLGVYWSTILKTL